MADGRSGLAELLRRHILITADVMEAAEEGNGAKLKDDAYQWCLNAGEIATVMNGSGVHGGPKPPRGS